ncbi:MAG: hypothetical protein CMQ20_14935 [Gammaproteobacteria bacterium]|jgi:hypothetical protein|nr:hypothetical protein [Gammaproteobacteria bacterium]
MQFLRRILRQTFKALQLIFICLVMRAPACFAIVDVQDNYYSHFDADTVSVFSFDFKGSSGNDENKSVSVANHTIHRGEKSTVLAIASYAQGDSNGVDTSDNGSIHLRYVRPLREPHGFELFAQYGQNRFVKLDRRIVAGGGYRFEWKQGTPSERGVIGLGVMREYERYVGLAEEQKLWRGNLYVSWATPLTSNSSVSLTAYAQPAFRDFSDVRVISTLILKAKLTERLGVRFSAEYTRDSDPEAGLENSNFNYTSGLTYSFSRN